MIYHSNSPAQTGRIGEELARAAVPGQVFCLYGDLGVGKTVFTQGFAKGLAIEEPISSPTFTIIQTYEDGKMPFYHFDVYRIGDPEEMDEIGLDDYIYGEGVCLIEWANLIRDMLPSRVTAIRIEKDVNQGFDYRKITIEEEEV